MAPPSLTILVPTNDRPDVLGRVWGTWLDQEGLTQIVIVDDGSVHDYSAVLEELRTAAERVHVGVRVVRLPSRRGAPAARNAGLSFCTGDEILTVDDDIALTPDVVAQCRAARPASSRAIVGPRVVYLRDDESETAADERALADLRPYVDLETLTLVPWVRPAEVLRVPFVTAVALWPRRLFEDGLRYFEGYGGNGYREETDPQIQAQHTYGAEVFFAPNAKVFHLPPAIAYARKSGQRRGGLLSFEWHVAKNNARFLARHGRFLRETYGARPVHCWGSLLRTRLSGRRLRTFLARRFSAQ